MYERQSENNNKQISTKVNHNQEQIYATFKDG